MLKAFLLLALISKYYYNKFSTGFHMAYFFKKRFYLLFLDRMDGREKVREKNINVWLPLTTKDPACNPGMGPDWESNW